MFKVKIFLLLMLTTTKALGTLWITDVSLSGNQYRYTLHWDLNGYVAPGGQGYYDGISLFSQMASEWTRYSQGHTRSLVKLNRNLSHAEALQAFINKNGLQGSFSMNHYAPNANAKPVAACLGRTGTVYNGGNNIPDWGLESLPGLCGTIPPVNTVCDFTSADIELAFGTITPEQADGRMANTNFSVNCNRGASVSYSAPAAPGGDVIFGNGIHGKLLVDGRPLGTILNLRAGTNTHNLSMTLSNPTLASGSLNKSLVLIRSYR